MAEAASAEFFALQQVVAGRYSLERELGRGGMGIVFLARDVALDRPVAIKLLPPSLAMHQELHDRFLREARTAAKLSHPNIVSVHAVEEHDDLAFFVMGFVDGETLGERVRRKGPLPLSQAVRVIREAAWALAYAHRNGVVHRDVKPDNILLEQGSGRAMLTDFGIARVAEMGTLTDPGSVIGTVHYMSPEQAAGEEVDARSDLYSLGVTAYFTLTGKLPFEGPNAAAVIALHAVEPPPRLASLRTDIPARLAQAVDRCLAKSPAQRFPSGEELAEALGATVSSPREVPPQIRALLRQFRDAALIAGLLAAGVFGGGFETWMRVFGVIWEDIVTRIIILMSIGAALIVGPFRFLKAAGRAQADGLTHDDVRVALLGEARAVREESDVVYGPFRMKTKRERAAATMKGGRFLFRSGIVTALLGIPAALMTDIGWDMSRTGGLITALGLILTSGEPDSGPLLGLSWVERVMAGRVGRWLLKLAGMGTGKTTRKPPPSSDRTEVVLGAAIAGFYKRLPSGIRNRFPAIPNIVQQLQNDAEALRKREEQLARAIAEAQPVRQVGNPERRRGAIEDLEQAHRTVGERLASSVAAIENIRLDLLRLQSGIDCADELTEDLKRARALQEEIDAGHRLCSTVIANQRV